MSRAAFTVAHPRATALRALNYTPEVEQLRRAKNGRGSVPLGQLLRSIGKSYGEVFTRIDCVPPHGVELLSQTDMFAAEPEGRRIRRDSMPSPDQHLVQPWQVLIAAAGTLGENELYGRALIADNRLAGKYVGPHAMVLDFEEPGSDRALFTYAFLGTRIGLRAVRSASYGTKVLGLRVSMLRELPVPQAEDDTVTRVAALVRTSVSERERFGAELACARELIEQMPAVQEALAACGERRGRVGLRGPPFHTLNAWNYVSTGEALPLLHRVWPSRLGDVVPADGVFNGLRFARVECMQPHGIELLTQRDVFLVRQIPQRVVHPGFVNRWLFVDRGTIIVGGAGTLGEGEIFGRAVFVSESMSRFAVTQDMLRIKPAGEYAAIAYAFLSTLLGRRLLRSTGVGTKLLRMRPDLIRSLPFPEVDASTTARVAGHLEAAMRGRDAGEAAEAEAVRLVEAEVVPAWLS